MCRLQSAASSPSYEREGWGGQGLAQSGDLRFAGSYSNMASSYNSQLDFQEDLPEFRGRHETSDGLSDAQGPGVLS